MKRQLIVLMGVLCTNFLSAQNETDALRYSYLNYGGTARFMGSGGSMSALGADMSAITLNPAGMGRYSRGDFSFTTNFTNTGSEALYNGNTASDNRFNMNISNLGAVFVVPVTDGSQWRNVQFGYTYNRTNDFQSNTIISGTHNNSQLDVFTEWAQGIAPGDLYDNASFDAGIAYDAFLLDYDSIGGTYYPWYSTDNIQQTKTIQRRGAQYSSDIMFSGNYADKFLIGGGLGFPSIRYNETSNLNETFIGDTVYDIDNYDYGYDLRTRGSGFNMKFGIIAIPHKMVRIGLAVHSPTWYSMNDRYSASIDSYFTNGDNYVSNSKEGFYEYRLRTPARLMGSIGVVLGKRGFVSAEYEYIDYANAKFNNRGTDNYSFNNENETIGVNYQSTGNIKLGAEYRVANNWTVRGGFARYGSPIKSNVIDFDASRTNISGGFGYRNRSFSLDLAYVLSKTTENYYLYDPNITNPARIDNSTGNVMLTAGFRF